MSTPTVSEIDDYTPTQRRRILSLARTAVTQILSYQDPGDPAVSPDETFLLDHRGCFVSLHHRHGRLRGCIGSFEPDRPLAGMIVRMAAATTRDPRFVHRDPVVLAEINDIHIEVSILTPMQRIADPLSMRIGIDGLSIRGAIEGRAVGGCFLPQVAREQRWTAEQTLSYCCEHKMGLPPDAWRNGHELEFFFFQSVIVSEADHA